MDKHIIQDESQQTYEQLLVNNQNLLEQLNVLESQASNLQCVQKELKVARQKLKVIFEQSGTSLMILDPNTSDGIPVIVDANKVACELHGYTRAEFIGKPIDDIDDEDGKRMCLERTQQMLHGESLNIENTHIRKDGTTFPVAIYANLVEVEGELPLIITTEHDITERIRLEKKNKELLKSETMHNEEREKRIIYTATVSSAQHILNNLLTSMQLFQMKAEKSNIFDEKTEAQFYHTIREGAELVKKLSAVEVLTASNIKESVYPKSAK